MIKPFTGDFKITQEFDDPCCREFYFRFNLKGHNGIDFGLPCETKLISPITGNIVEVTNDLEGYGLYIKIENSAEGCLLAHLSKQDVIVGQKVDEGQHIGWSGTTGNSTGCHLHFGYFQKPRDKTNGFNGYIDPTPYFDENVIIPPTIMEITDSTKIPGIENKEVQQIRSELLAKDARIKDLDSINTQQATMIKDLTNDLSSCLSKPTEAPKNALEAFKVLLHYIFK